MARAELPSFFTPSADTEESRKLNEKNAKTRRAIKGLLRQKRNLAVSQGKGSSGKGLAFGKSSSSGKGIGSSGNFTGSSGKGTYSSGKGTYSSGKGTYSSGKGTYSSGKGSYSSGKGSSSSGKGSSSFEDDAFVDDSVFSDITFILASNSVFSKDDAGITDKMLISGDIFGVQSTRRLTHFVPTDDSKGTFEAVCVIIGEDKLLCTYELIYCLKPENDCFDVDPTLLEESDVAQLIIRAPFIDGRHYGVLTGSGFGASDIPTGSIYFEVDEVDPYLYASVYPDSLALKDLFD